MAYFYLYSDNTAENVILSPVIALFCEIGVAESNDNCQNLKARKWQFLRMRSEKMAKG